MIPELKARWPNTEAIEISDRTTPAELDLVREMAENYDAIVAGIFVRASSGSGRLDLAPQVVRLLQDLSRDSERDRSRWSRRSSAIRTRRCSFRSCRRCC